LDSGPAIRNVWSDGTSSCAAPAGRIIDLSISIVVATWVQAVIMQTPAKAAPTSAGAMPERVSQVRAVFVVSQFANS
jgi:hypothetical protein